MRLQSIWHLAVRRTGRMKKRSTNDRIGAAGCSCSSWSKILFSLAFPSSTLYDSQKPTRHALICESVCTPSGTYSHLGLESSAWHPASSWSGAERAPAGTQTTVIILSQQCYLDFCGSKALRYCRQHMPSAFAGGWLRPLPPPCLLAMALDDLSDEGTRNHDIRHGVTV